MQQAEQNPMDAAADAGAWFPLSEAQLSRWFLYQRDPSRQGGHNIGFCVRVHAALPAARLRAALQRLVERHPMLRTRFRAGIDGPEQAVAARVDVSVHGNPIASDAADLAARVRVDCRRPFDLAQAPLIRAHLYHVGDAETVLLLVMDHLVADGWSYWQILDELDGLLREPVGDSLPQIPAACYADYVRWQREWRRSAAAETQWQHWRQALAGELPMLQLTLRAGVTAGEGAAAQSGHGNVAVCVAPALATALNALSRAQAGTLFTTLLAAYQVLLHRHSGQDDIIVGSPMPGRSRGEWDRVVGDFVNPVAIRTRFAADVDIVTLLKQVRNSTLRAMTHQDLPFGQLVERLQPPRGPQHPVFQTLFTLQKSRGSQRLLSLWDARTEAKVEWGGHAVSAFPAIAGGAGGDFMLALDVIELDDTIRCDFSFDAASIDAASVERMAGHFIRVLEAFVADPQQRVADIELLSAGERDELLRGLNDTGVAFPHGGRVHDAFEAQAAATPGVIALCDESTELSYRELNRRANRVAHRLLALGVSPDDRVAVCVDRRVDMVIGLLGILKAGAAYVPLDPSLPAQRLGYIVSDSAPVAVLAHSSQRDRLPAHPSPTLLLDDPADLSPDATADANPVVVDLHEHHLAYVMYTSGSTGAPKGVMVEHANVVNLIHTHIRHCGMGAGDAVLQFAPFGFDISVEEIFPALSVGARVVLRPDSLVAPDGGFLQLLREQHITIADLPTPFWQQWVLAGSLDGDGLALRLVVVGGEKGERRHLETWKRSPLGQRCGWLHNYGPTEATVYASALLLQAGDAVPAGEIPIGGPNPNTRIYLLDAQRQPVPIGVVGEIHIGGAGVTRGYLNLPELTAERFIDDPFDAAGGRLYRTGDLARWREDRTLEFLGRNDFQVKIRGFRIELGEIEARLASCAGVREAVVIAREDGGDKRLVAYVVPLEGAELTTAGLRAELAASLADYMVPSAFVTLTALPMTANDKLDRAALPAPDDSAVVQRQYEAPCGAVERAVAGIWQQLLKLQQIGRSDHFFELGGHSLMALQMVGRLRSELGAEIGVRELFAQPTLAGFAACVASAARGSPSVIAAVDRTQPIPLSFAQQRLWFVDRLDPIASRAFHMPAALRLNGRLDSAVLQAALDRIVARHESLRTTFADVDGHGVQQIAAPDCGFALAMADLRDVAVDGRGTAVDRIAADEAIADFDLTRGPLIRGRLLRLADDEHVLLITQHHIVSDGWSVTVLLQELSALYAAFSRGEADPLPLLPVQYADFSAWQRGMLAARRQAQCDFWFDTLHGAPELLALPTDRPRPPTRDHVGGCVPLALSADVSTAIRTLAQRHGCTVFMTLLAAWSLLLSRLSGQRDVVVGTPIANRPHPDVEPLIGFFVNMLPLRVQLSDDSRVSALLAQVRDTTLAAYEHQDLPFEQIVDRLQPARSRSHHPLFQAMLSLNNTPGADALQLPGIDVSEMSPARVAAHFDLSLVLADDGDVLTGELVFARDLFDAATVERIGSQLDCLLTAMVADDGAQAGTLPLLDPRQRDQLLVEFNDTRVDYPRDALIHECFEAQAQRHPDAVALEYEGSTLSYAELDRRSDRLAQRLAVAGVQPRDRVAICAERSIELIVGLLAILKAGAVYVPVDPLQPPARLAFLLEDCAPAAVLLQPGLDVALQSIDVPRMMLGDADDESAVQSRAVRERQADATDAAYIIYTSGSTGTPKGVVVSHRSVNRLVINAGYFTAGPGDCLAHAANPAFDAATWEIWGALLNGARVLILPQAVLLDTPALDRALVAARVTALWMTVGLFNQAAEQMQQSLGRLQTLIVGGDALDPRCIRRLLQRERRPAQVVNGYGPTETTTFACTHDIRNVADDATSIPIGRPISNTRVYILDAHREPVPIGVAGELFIGGDGVARGYWNQPELTAERFVDDPFSPLPQARMYRTGDLGRWRADGTIEFLGRNDFQVKIRGFRIELGEIEHRLASCDGVREAVVVVREDTPGDKRLVAYVIADAAAGAGASALREALAASLADYMIPSAFVFVSAFPLTANGKLDRKALPAPDDAAVARPAFSPPSGDTEQAVAVVWQAVLGLDRVGRDDHFFEIGGHSLLALQLVSRLRSECGVEVGLRELFDHPTLAGFCARVDVARSGTSVAKLASIPPADRSAPLPLSFAQQRLWFVDRLDAAAGAAYHMPSAMRLRGRLDVAALQASLDAIVARHEVLRTSFVEVDGLPLQRIADAGIGFALECIDPLPACAQAAGIERMAAEEAARPFDLSTGPLIRGLLLRISDDEHVLLLTQHHIISDGWSVAVLVRELAALYAAFVDGRADPLPPLPLQYADFAAWQRSVPAGESLRAQAAYWKQTLAGAPDVLAMPTDRPRPPRQSHAGARVSFTLPLTLCEGLHALGRRHSATLFMTLMAGWSALLSRLSGQTDIVVGTPVANRERSELEPLIGFFVNSLALRIDLDDRPSVATLLSRVKAATLGAFEHQALPFEHVVDLLQPTRSLAHSPLFQVMLSLNNTPGGDALVLPGLAVEPLETARDAAHFDLSLSLVERDGALLGDLVYATDLFDAATIERIATQFQRLLAAMVADDSRRVDELSLIDDVERRHLLHGCNDTARDWPRDALIHSLFEQQTARRPQQVALQCGEQQLSYDQLNRRANRLAHRLVALGVRPDDRVAICAERSIEMVVGLLAILKAGGAYMPLDPGYPLERLAYMLDDGAPVALLAQAAELDRLPTTTLPLLALDGVASDALAGPAGHDLDIDRADIGLDPTHLAYVIYTSGSTGAAKGVMVEHRNVVQLCIDNPFAPIDADDCIVHCANPAFDASTWEIWGGLLNGARVLVVPQAVLLDPPRFADALADGGATASFLTVALFNQYADALSGVLPRMNHLLFGGEKTDLKQIKRVFRDCRPQHLVHCYGPTETTTFTTTLDIVALADDAQALPIGRPIGNSRIYILDGGGQPVPVGVPGEIHVGGDGVARGYLNRPELSSERFLADPFMAGADARMYRTGDLARWLPDGTIEFLARNDSQVKIRGFRIELGEIETRLAGCTGVREAVVVVREDSPGDKRLVAYVVADSTSDDEAPTAAGLRRELAAGLAEVMIPGAFVMLDALPLTPNGKLDRRALPAPDAASIVAREYQPPQGPVEQALADIWQQLLGIERVGRSDQFFELGGHSLMAVQLAGRIREHCHVDVALRDLFEHPQLVQLAERVTALQFEQFMGDDVEALENELAGLSEDELRAILASEGASIEQA